MPVELDFVELKRSSGETYLNYHCETCNEEHISRCDPAVVRQIRKACRVCDEVVLWCGNGQKPEPQLDFGMVQVIMPKVRLSKKRQKELKRIVAQLDYDVAHDFDKIDSLKDEIREKLKRIRMLGEIPDKGGSTNALQ